MAKRSGKRDKENPEGFDLNISEAENYPGPTSADFVQDKQNPTMPGPVPDIRVPITEAQGEKGARKDHGPQAR